MKRLIILFLLGAAALSGCSPERSDTPKPIPEQIRTEDERNAALKESRETPEEAETTEYELVSGDNVTVALEFTKDILAENFDKLLYAYRYDDKMKAAMSKEDTKKSILFYNAGHGDMQEIREAYASAYGNYRKVIVPVICANEKFGLQVAFDADNNIAGFTYTEFQEKQSRPDRKIPDGAVEEEYSFRSDGFLLTGTLTRPKEGSDFPVVVFVHGSGPSDRDESIFENKPFRDIAWALAEQGIASYRYDKRSYLYGKQIQEDKTVTVYDESINDAVAAAGMVGKLEGINPDKIYILGHSLGGYVIPRIAEKFKAAAGFIIMAGPAEHITKYIVQQYEYLAQEDGSVTAEEQQTIDSVRKQIALLKQPQELSENGKVLGAYKDYWIDLDGYDAVKTAKKIKAPVLVLQGERDYQVNMDQFRLWKKAFGKKDNWIFQSYPLLNHFMMPGEGDPGPAEYERVSTVDIQVVWDIAGLINK